MQSEFRKALAEGDVARVRGMWATAFPRMPQPETAAEAEIAMHYARTAAESLALAPRLYSHAWLDERGFPSALPDELRPPPERVHPVVFRAVGVAVGALHSDRRDEAKALEKVMAAAAGEMIACGITDSARISRRMWEARAAFKRGRMGEWV